jgi:hypothetical protein
MPKQNLILMLITWILYIYRFAYLEPQKAEGKEAEERLLDKASLEKSLKK